MPSNTYPRVVDFLERLVLDGAQEDDALQLALSVLRRQLDANHLRVTHNDVAKCL